MKLSEALANRRAVRDFLPDAVSQAVLQELIEAAVQAPSYMNLQPWSFAVVRERARVADLAAQARRHLLVSMTHQSPFFVQRDELAAPGFEMFYGAPALIVVCATQPGAHADSACAMAAFSLMLTAEASGLGSCWVSQAMPWFESAEGRAALKLAPEQRAVAPVILGAPAAAPLSPGRFKPRITWIGETR